MSQSLNLQIDLCDRIGPCHGITDALKLLKKTLIRARLTFRQVYYKDPPHEAKRTIDAIISKGVPVIEWHPGISRRAIQMISPYGAPQEAYESRCADGTCSFVKAIRQQAVKAHKEGRQVIFLADQDSSEVQFINTFIDNTALVVSTFEEAKTLDLDAHPKVAILSQSAFRRDLFDGILRVIHGRYPEKDIVVSRTICPEIIQRAEEIKRRVYLPYGHDGVMENLTWEDFANLCPYNVVVFVGDYESKQCNFLTVEVAPYIPDDYFIWAEKPENIGCEQFKPGDKVLLATGPEVMPDKIAAIKTRLENLTDTDKVIEPHPLDACGTCSQKDKCPRHECLHCQCDMMGALMEVLRKMA